MGTGPPTSPVLQSPLGDASEAYDLARRWRCLPFSSENARFLEGLGTRMVIQEGSRDQWQPK